MSILNITERETALEKELEDALYAWVLIVLRCQKLEAERDGIKGELATLQAKVASSEASEPLFWYRPCSDGCYEGPISNSSIEDVRKTSGAWVPLVAAGACVLKPGESDAQAALAIKPDAQEQRKPLTRDRMIELLGGELDSSDAAFVTFGRAVEAEHGITGDPA